jgi:hypothetical protein
VVSILYDFVCDTCPSYLYCFIFISYVTAGGAAGATAGVAIGGYGASQIESMDKKNLKALGLTLNPGILFFA